MLNAQVYPDDLPSKKHFILGGNPTISVTEAHFWVTDDMPLGPENPAAWAEGREQVPGEGAKDGWYPGVRPRATEPQGSGQSDTVSHGTEVIRENKLYFSIISKSFQYLPISGLMSFFVIEKRQNFTL